MVRYSHSNRQKGEWLVYNRKWDDSVNGDGDGDSNGYVDGDGERDSQGTTKCMNLRTWFVGTEPIL